jgi:hypothetical protein
MPRPPSLTDEQITTLRQEADVRRKQAGFDTWVKAQADAHRVSRVTLYRAISPRTRKRRSDAGIPRSIDSEGLVYIEALMIQHKFSPVAALATVNEARVQNGLPPFKIGLPTLRRYLQRHHILPSRKGESIPSKSNARDFPTKRRGPRGKGSPPEGATASRHASSYRPTRNSVDVRIRLRFRDGAEHEAVVSVLSTRREVVHSTVSDAIQHGLWISDVMLRPGSSVDSVEILSIGDSQPGEVWPSE